MGCCAAGLAGLEASWATGWAEGEGKEREGEHGPALTTGLSAGLRKEGGGGRWAGRWGFGPT